jgi:uncharacterized membrane protein
LSSIGRVLRNPAVQTGAVLGAIAAVRSFQPSLMPRSARDEGVIAAASIASGYLAGNAVERGIGFASELAGIDRAYPAAVVAGASHLVARSDLPEPARTAATVAGLAATLSAGLAIARRSGRGGLAAAALGAAAGLGLSRQLRSFPDDGKPTPPPSEVANALATALGIAGAAWAALAAERATARGIARLGSRFGGPTWLWLTAAHAVLIETTAAGANVAARRALDKLDTAADRIEPGYADAPTSPLVTGGPGSAADFEGLGVQGRRFVLEATPAAQIDRVMGTEDAKDPIRVYIGIDHADTIEARVGLAFEELRRTGAFDRSLLIVGSPSGTGYLNYIPIEAAEYFTGGDIASVTIQYGKRPSLLSANKVDLARRQHGALVDRIAAELARRPADHRPRLALYGESLGAQTGEDAFPQPGYEALRRRSIDHALWVGTPYATRFQRAVMASNPGRDHFARAASIAELDRGARYTFLDHHEDPVTRYHPAIWYRRPSWLGPPEERPPNVSQTQRWVPAVTFWQTAFDTKNAARVIPGEFRAFGHDYRADLAEFVRAAYRIEGVTDEQMASVEAALRRSEVERATRIEQR